MYKLIYTVPFMNVDGEALIVHILEDGGNSASVELTGGTPPFIVDVNDEDFLYTPTRFSGATLKLVGSDYLQKLFSTQYQKFKVNLVKEGSIIWTGFISPELYSQDFDNNLFELEIECVSALSTLEYIDFKDDSEIISFMDIIKKCITASKGDYKGVFVPNTYTSQLSSLTVSTSNFIDEDGKAMTLKECLGEVCKFLNWTVIEYDGNVYFIDIDYIKAGKTSYTDILTNTSTTLSSIVNLRNVPSKGNSNVLSILGGYNKAIVIDSDYEIDSDDLFPSLSLDGQIASNTTVADASGKAGNNTTYISNYYNSSNFKKYQYKKSGTTWSTAGSLSQNQAGTHIVNTTSYSNDNKPLDLNWQEVFEVKLFGDNMNDLLDESKPSTDLREMMKQYQQLANEEYSGFLKPIFTNTKRIGNTYFPSDAYLGISFSTLLTPKLNNPQFRGIPKELNHKDDTPDAFVAFDSNLSKSLPKLYTFPMELKIGNKYYNGSNWTTTKSIFYVPMDVKKDTHIEGKWLPVKNTNNFELGVSDLGECYTIKLEEGLYGTLELTAYLPVYLARSKAYIYIKNFSVDVCRIDKSDTRKEKKDTKYENVVNGEYINELEDITFKLTSKNDSQLSYSKVIANNKWLDTLTSTIDNKPYKPEEYLIERIINQYKQPKIKLTQIIEPKILPYSVVTDSLMSGKKFVFTGGRIDYEDNRIECNLIELN